MKEKYWKYITLSLSALSIIFLAYGFLFSSSMGFNVTKYAPVNIIETDYDTISFTTGPVQPLALGGLEIIQDEYTAALYISEQNRGYAQSVAYGGLRHTNGFYMLIGRHGNPTEPIVLSLDYDKSTGEYYQGQRSIWIYPDDISEEDYLYWIDNFFEDNPFVEDSLFVTAVSLDDQDDGNYWFWAYSDQSPYTGGMLLKINQDWTYGNADSSWDGTFALHTEEAAPEEPVISISVNAATQTLGIISLLGAAFSSIKYGLVIGWL